MWNIISWEQEGYYRCSKMFRWEPEGCYRHRLLALNYRYDLMLIHFCISHIIIKKYSVAHSMKSLEFLFWYDSLILWNLEVQNNALHLNVIKHLAVIYWFIMALKFRLYPLSAIFKQTILIYLKNCFSFKLLLTLHVYESLREHASCHVGQSTRKSQSLRIMVDWHILILNFLLQYLFSLFPTQFLTNVEPGDPAPDSAPVHDPQESSTQEGAIYAPSHTLRWGGGGGEEEEEVEEVRHGGDGESPTRYLSPTSHKACPG